MLIPTRIIRIATSSLAKPKHNITYCSLKISYRCATKIYQVFDLFRQSDATDSVEEMASKENTSPTAAGKGKSIVFVHPDLGIGGAERLVIDAAVGMQKLGHKVTIFTSYCDKSHCFEEARDGKC